jgi:hypothetical protein
LLVDYLFTVNWCSVFGIVRRLGAGRRGLQMQVGKRLFPEVSRQDPLLAQFLIQWVEGFFLDSTVAGA